VALAAIQAEDLRKARGDALSTAAAGRPDNRIAISALATVKS